ncbi:PAS domain S-box protein [Thermovirga sp.]|uniref:PAS domain S-box protein n=1 Tax=Thermovirga sp. TaxID=2699834 RepID=UPI0025D64C97|nr:PAS domain S-box protein [Thermovirga sp.]MBO8154336.1 PAS domain S-box protein [Thermovirga sp.]
MAIFPNKRKKEADSKGPTLGDSFFESLFENSPEAIIICDREERIIRANRMFCQLFGYSKEEVMGRNGNEIVAPTPDLMKEAEAIDRMMWSSKEKISLETVRLRRDGKAIPVELLQIPFELEDGTVYDYTIYRDITERKNAEYAFRREKAFFEKLFEATPSGIMICDSKGKIVRTNPAFLQLFGYDKEEVTGKLSYNIVAQDARLMAEAREIDRRFWSGENIHMRVKRQRKDGKILHLELVQVPLILDQETMLCYVIYRDISDQVKAEEALKESEKRYQAVIQDQDEFIVRLNSQGVLTFVNDAYCRYKGIPKEELLGSTIFDCKDPKTAERLKKELLSFLSPKAPVKTTEIYNELPNGKKQFVQWRNRGIFDKNGNLVEIQSVGRDVTELKEAQEKLKRLNTVLKSVRDIHRLINTEKDPTRLIQSICVSLIVNHGYPNVWIAILEVKNYLATIYEAAMIDGDTPISERMSRKELNMSSRKVLESPDVIVEEEVIPCSYIPLLDEYPNKYSMSARLEYQGHVFGLITVALSREYNVTEEEKTIFKETAQDIAMALYNIKHECGGIQEQ